MPRQSKWVASLAALATSAFAASALAQPQPGAESSTQGDAEAMRALEARMRELEERTRRAETELASLKRAVDQQRSPAPDGEGDDEERSPKITLGGYAEVYYQWNINNPSNGITNYRGFDNRHNTFTISNVALDGQLEYGGAQARVTLQAGHTPDTYYLAEPLSPGTAGANTSSADTWRLVQQAYVGYELEVLDGLLMQGGIFLSPIGPESMPVKDNWQWSRSNLFFGLPFYHTGARATLNATDRWGVTLAIVNGWNSVVDNNPEKSGYAQLTYTTDDLAWSLLYFGGIERADDVPEGDPWRSTFDTHVTWTAARWLKIQPHLDAGFEPNDLGTSFWVAGALATQFRMLDWLFLGVRGDVFYEKPAARGAEEAARIFWPVDWVASQTATVEARVLDHISLRLEARHDSAAGEMFFRDEVVGNGLDAPYVPNARDQTNLTLGATAWF